MWVVTAGAAMATLTALVGGPGPALAQEAPAPAPAPGRVWNDPFALDLVSRARDLRQSVQVDSTLRSYAADARGWVYFFLDRDDSDERSLVKTDQIALELYWRAPDSTRQRIVGRRDAEQLPTGIRYHLDHLTVVQDEFQDVIRMGDGDEVSAVPHPVAPGAEAHYDYRVSDSLAVSYAGGTVRVYELEVRPKDLGRPGFVGTLSLSRETAAIVRMRFTFTPGSYVDDYLDYIRVSLDNGLWEGRYWLPYEQRVELRREFPWVDLPAGTVIRGRYRISNYRFNPDLPPGFFRAPRVTTVPDSARRAFAFEDSLYADVDRESLAPLPDLADIRRQAVQMAGTRMVSGLGRLRWFVPSASEVFRYNRAEGFALGAGVTLTPTETFRARIAGGHRFGADRPWLGVDVEQAVGPRRWWLRGELQATRDLGLVPGSSGAVNTLAGAFDRDFLDPYTASSVGVGVDHDLGSSSRIGLGITWERHRPMTNVVHEGRASGASGIGRPVRPVRPGDGLGVRAQSDSRLARGVDLSVSGEVGAFGGERYATARVGLELRRAWLGRGLDVWGRVDGAAVSAGAPDARVQLLGGRSTLPGYPYRSLGGRRSGLARFEVGRAIREPWLRLGLTGAVGRTWAGPGGSPSTWGVAAPGMLLYSGGFAARFLWDTVRLDLARGLNGGHWDLFVSVRRSFHSWL